MQTWSHLVQGAVAWLLDGSMQWWWPLLCRCRKEIRSEEICPKWTWVWVESGSWWWTGRPGVLRFMGPQRVGHDWVTELNWTEWWKGFPSGQMVKNLPAVWETQVWSLGQEGALEKGLATHSSILAWRSPCAEKPGGLHEISELDMTERLSPHFSGGRDQILSWSHFLFLLFYNW